LGAIDSPKSEEQDYTGGKTGFKDTSPKDTVVEAFVVQADLVQVGILLEHRSWVLLVKYRIEDDWKCCERYIVTLVEPLVIQSLAAES